MARVPGRRSGPPPRSAGRGGSAAEAAVLRVRAERGAEATLQALAPGEHCRIRVVRAQVGLDLAQLAECRTGEEVGERQPRALAGELVGLRERRQQVALEHLACGSLLAGVELAQDAAARSRLI